AQRGRPQRRSDLGGRRRRRPRAALSRPRPDSGMGRWPCQTAAPWPTYRASVSELDSYQVKPQAVGASTGGLVDAAGDGVVWAVVLGWPMAELFHSRIPGSVRRRQVSLDKLAGIGELDPLSQARLLLAQVRVDLRRGSRVLRPGQRAPDTGPVR